ncbi:MAG: quinone oxidoreductase family protein, partial [Mycobacteriaceae bacterium]
MRAIQVTKLGGPEVLDIAELPIPTPGSKDLLIKTDAVGINYIDTYIRSGYYQHEVPYIPGSEGSGTIITIGPEVSGDFNIGDRIAWCTAPESYAEYVKVPYTEAIPIPEPISAEVAASILLQGMTAHYLINSTFPAKKGDTILVHAGAGGVGLILTQLATAKGVRVISTVSTAEKEKLAKQAGAEQVLRYSADLAAEVRGLTNGQGVAAVYDGVGKATFNSSIASLRTR